MGRIVDVSEVMLECGLGSASPSDEERALAEIAIQRAEGQVIEFLQYDPVQLERTEYYPMAASVPTGGLGTWEVNDHVAYVRHLTEADTSELYLRHLPIRGISALHVDYDGRSGTKSQAFGDGTSKQIGTDYWANFDGHDSSGQKLCRDGILHSIGLWPAEPGSIKVVYTAGYTADELRGRDSHVHATPIWETVLIEAAKKLKRAMLVKKSDSIGWVAGPLTWEQIGNYNYRTDASAVAALFGKAVDLDYDAQRRLGPFVNMAYSIAG